MEIMAFLGSIKYVLIAIGVGILSIWGWIQNKKIKERDRTIQEQENVIKVHESKEIIRNEDDEIDKKVEEEKTELEEKVEGKSDEDAIKIVEDVLDSYFGSKPKSE